MNFLKKLGIGILYLLDTMHTLFLVIMLIVATGTYVYMLEIEHKYKKQDSNYENNTTINTENKFY